MADLRYVSLSVFVYVAFAPMRSAAPSRAGVSDWLHAALALDSLEMALWSRGNQELEALIHHSDRSVQYLAICYTERLAAAGAARSVGSRADGHLNHGRSKGSKAVQSKERALARTATERPSRAVTALPMTC